MICSKREFPPLVLQNTLTLFGTLVTALGPVTRIMVECFFMFVYLKGLVQFNDLLVAREEAVSQEDPAARFIMPPTSGFSLEELSILLESLTDLALARGFLQSLFATFDCDPTKPDIVRPLLSYMSKCTRVALILDPQDLGNLSEISSLCLQSFLQMSRLLADRCQAGHDSASATSSSSTTSEAKTAKGGSSSRRADLVEHALVGSKYLLAVRASKTVLVEASRRFTEKPSEGLKFLQANGALPSPLTPESVAEFLRIAPELPKENVGMYMGELGKGEKECKYEGDGKEFHQQVLLCYVKSFTLTGQSVLNSMRIFLSAFRLPGEAQQIDRILVAFSENCFANCAERESGVGNLNPELDLITLALIDLIPN